MITYKAMYKFLPDGVHGEVMDFPGAITCGANLEETRRLLAGALEDMAEVTLLQGESLPYPDPTATDAEADLEEPIYLILRGASRVRVIAEPEYEAA
jgi:predicted RNase H-like HicB family nuclease